MIIGFLSNKLTIRGTEVNLYNYADYNETILGNKSIIITRPYDHVMKVASTDVVPEAYTKFQNRFGEAMEYYINPPDVEDIIKKHKIDVIFIEKFGHKSDGLLFNSCKNIIHAVFRTEDPHGDLFAPVSNTLNELYGTNYPVLPNIVSVADTNENMRSELNIPNDATVFGVYGGADSFDIDYIKQAVRNVGTNPTCNDIYFIFLNIKPFCQESSRIKFLPGTVDLIYKRKFINTCDAMLYGRSGGESFGIACGEFSICNKLVIARATVFEYAHLTFLGENAIKHDSYDELIHILLNWSKYKKDVCNNGYVECMPEPVMRLFKSELDKLFKS